MEKKNELLIRRYYEQLWNQWDLSIAEEIIESNITFRGSLGVEAHGLAGFHKYMTLVRNAFPDFHNDIQELISNEERVTARLVYTGTHRGELLGIPATGKSVSYPGVAIFHIRSGKISEGYVIGHSLGLLEQIIRPKFWLS